ncbi:class I SAM-dependent methyltransferase [Occallatibacter riparius]|uniref:Class I SAM-dependent methyltransferase n=1 Tax=Occallatibacter riparius TaxID=1002689 RepID=A0A9J7BMH3_9BACT|nr:class I SAM-dependent methyltransferase [Occallatibacter riparius]UWZ82962.1 class I SAM-dependent methyltransferase [Occallatibacter riparius]
MNSSGERRRLPGLTVRDGLIPHPFDVENGVRTSGLVAGRHLKSGHAHDRHATAYFGVAPSVFHKLMGRWERTRPAAEISETTFIDVGAGMGRAVLLAAEMPFRQVIGVELHPALVRTARRNVAVWRKAGRVKVPVRVVQADAAEFAFPAEPTVLFLFNPFGAVVMRRLLKRLARAFAERPGALDVLYVNDEQAWVLEQQKGFARLFSGKVPRSRADNAADKRILDNQPDGEYASAPYEDCSIWRWMGVE